MAADEKPGQILSLLRTHDLDLLPVRQHRPDLKNPYLPYVQHDVDYLNVFLWDKQYDRFHWGAR